MILRSNFNNTENLFCCNSKQSNRLVDYSPNDKPWNKHKGNADDVASLYNGVLEFEKIQSQIYGCSGWLGFNWVCDTDTGESSLKLKQANFCRVRHCPVCQWRRSLMWQARFYESLPKILNNHKKSRWLFLTLTVRNCEIDNLRQTCQMMGRSWRKFIKRKELKLIKGWVRTTEVTYNRDNQTAHPHYHCLLLVPSSWFTHGYIKQSRFVELWSESLSADYDAGVYIKTVKPKKDIKGTLNDIDFLKGAVQETLKYTIKIEDLKVNKKWFIEYNRQVKGLRFIASGGVLKDVLKQDKKESNQDLININDDEGIIEDLESELLVFNWQSKRRQYERAD